MDRIVVDADRTIDIHLRCVPEKWQARILQGKAETEKFNRENHEVIESNNAECKKITNQGHSISHFR